MPFLFKFRKVNILNIFIFIFYYFLIYRNIRVVSFKHIIIDFPLIYNYRNNLYSRRCAECIVEFDDLESVSIDDPKDYKPAELRSMPIEELEKTITQTRRIVKKMELVRQNNPLLFVKSNYDIVRKLLARSLFIRHEIMLNEKKAKLRAKKINNPN